MWQNCNKINGIFKNCAYETQIGPQKISTKLNLWAIATPNISKGSIFNIYIHISYKNKVIIIKIVMLINKKIGSSITHKHQFTKYQWTREKNDLFYKRNFLKKKKKILWPTKNLIVCLINSASEFIIRLI